MDELLEQRFEDADEHEDAVMEQAEEMREQYESSQKVKEELMVQVVQLQKQVTKIEKTEVYYKSFSASPSPQKKGQSPLKSA